MNSRSFSDAIQEGSPALRAEEYGYDRVYERGAAKLAGRPGVQQMSSARPRNPALLTGRDPAVLPGCPE